MTEGTDDESTSPYPADAEPELGEGAIDAGLARARNERRPYHAIAEERERAEKAEAHEATLRDEDIVDSLPEDLDARAVAGPYLFPNNNRRRIPAVLYVAIGVLCITSWVLGSGNSVLVNSGVAFVGGVLALFGLFSWVAGWNLAFDERDALVAATREVGFPVGHASAQMGWRGLLSKPTWRILLYSNENPPKQRGLVLVDGVKGGVIEYFVEDNPEDWDDLTGTSA